MMTGRYSGMRAHRKKKSGSFIPGFASTFRDSTTLIPHSRQHSFHDNEGYHHHRNNARPLTQPCGHRHRCSCDYGYLPPRVHDHESSSAFESDSERDEKGHRRTSNQRTSGQGMVRKLMMCFCSLLLCGVIALIVVFCRLSLPTSLSELGINFPSNFVSSSIGAADISSQEQAQVDSTQQDNTTDPNSRTETYTSGEAVQTRYCSQKEASAGHWEPIPPVTITPYMLAIEETYPNPYRVSWHWCAPMPDIRAAGGGRWDNGRWDDGEWTEEERIAEGEKRSIEISAWEWVPEVGMMKEFDAIEFTVRLLRSPGGLILVGGTYLSSSAIDGKLNKQRSRQHYHTITRLLSKAGIEYDQDLPHLPMYDHKNVQQHTLKRNHPMTLKLLTLSGVPPSRLRRPIITMLEDHMLIGQTDIRELTYKYGAEEGYKWWYDFQRVRGWEEFVANASAPRIGEVDSVTEDTVVLMNTGPHWSRHEFNMLPTNRLAEEQARLRATYAGMVDKITERLSPIPQLSVYYRSTSPGHPGCRNRREPYLDMETARHHELNVRERLLKDASTEKERSGREVWDWDQFEEHNAIWKRKIRTINRNKDTSGRWKAKGKRRGANWNYLDIWDLSLQRPDAHNEPTDCLHWCMPVVLNEWTYQLYHVLYVEGEEARRESEGVTGESPQVPLSPWE